MNNQVTLQREQNQYLRRYKSAQSRRGKASARYLAGVDAGLWQQLQKEGNQERLDALEEAALLFCGDDPLKCVRGLRLLLADLTETERALLTPMLPFDWVRVNGTHLYEFRSAGHEASVYHNPFFVAGFDADAKFEWRVIHHSGSVLTGQVGTVEDAQRMAEIAILHPEIN